MNNCKCRPTLIQQSPGLAARLAHRLLRLDTSCGLCRAAELRQQRLQGITLKERALRAAARNDGIHPL